MFDLEAHVDLDLGPVQNPTGNSTPTTLVGFLMNRVVPSGLKRRIRKKEITRYSAEIGPWAPWLPAGCGAVSGHRLDYEVLWKGTPNL